MDMQPTLVGETLRADPMAPTDLDALVEAAGDPLIWAGHPKTTRHEPEEARRYFAWLLAHGGTLTMRDLRDGAVIGCSRYYRPPHPPEPISIGFTFLVRSRWGGASNREMKRLMLEHAFASEDQVWLHIAPSNIRSQKATAKLGARHVDTSVIDLGSGPAETQCWRLTPDDWRRAEDTARD